MAREVGQTEAWPADGLEEVATCPICGSSERSVMFDGLKDRIFHCAPGTWRMMRCAICQSGYLDPRPTPDTIGQAYEHYYTHSPAPPGESKFARVRRALANGYKNFRFGASLAPASSLGIPLAFAMPEQRRILDRQFRHLPRNRGGGGRMLDVGCGDGGFLRNAEAMGWEAIGTDLDPVAVGNARKAGLDVRLGMIEEVDGPFDAITISHVLEHVHDPPGLLKACHDRLVAGGTIWIETPNVDALGLAHFGADWRGLEPPRHLVLFSLSALRRALVEAGFVNVRNLAQPGVTKGLFETSEAIRQRATPASPTRLPALDWLAMKGAAAVERFRPDRREFLAVAAIKADAA